MYKKAESGRSDTQDMHNVKRLVSFPSFHGLNAVVFFLSARNLLLLNHPEIFFLKEHHPRENADCPGIDKKNLYKQKFEDFPAMISALIPSNRDLSRNFK